MRKMVPSERFEQIDKALKGAYVDIETSDFMYSLSDFNVTGKGYCYVDFDISHIPNDAIVMCRQEIDFSQLLDSDLRNDVLSKIYIDDTRQDTPNVVRIYFLNATLPQDDMNMTFRLYIFYKSTL